MSLKALRYFVVTAEELNITRAADRLFLSQQALSRHIQRLEEEYHTTFFLRHPSLQLTDEGKRFLSYAKRALANEQDIREVLADISQNCRHTLSVGMSRLRAESMFLQIYDTFHAAHPNISIDLHNGTTQSNIEQLQNGQLDFVIGVNLPNLDRIQRIPLLTNDLRACFSSDFLKRFRPDTWERDLQRFHTEQGVRLAELLDLPLLTLRNKHQIREEMNYFLKDSPAPILSVECDTQPLIYDLAKNGYGVGIITTAVFRQGANQQARLKGSPLLFNILDFKAKSNLHLAFRQDRVMPQYMLDFCQCCRIVSQNTAPSQG